MRASYLGVCFTPDSGLRDAPYVMKLPRGNFLRLAAGAAPGSPLPAVSTTIVALSSGSALAAATGAAPIGCRA
jgi:hypothetical protein